MIDCFGETNGGLEKYARIRKGGYLVADAIRLRSQSWADLPRVHPRLQILDVAHRLPCDFVVNLLFCRWKREGTQAEDRSGHFPTYQTTRNKKVRSITVTKKQTNEKDILVATAETLFEENP